jgi:asparagine synthase (glutamine-hydrolysing)
VAAALAATSGDEARVSALLTDLHGHFAVVASAPGWAVAAVDRIRSTPLFLAETAAGPLLGARAPRLVAAARLARIDPAAALSFAMAGYTIGTDTLYAGLSQLAPGEAVLFRGEGAPLRRRYHRYAPWQVVPADRTRLRRQLAEATLAIIERLAAEAAGRTIAVPLSAGRDSRLIASALAHVGCRNVVCFAYGLAGNHEAVASERIAEKLGFPWRFFPYTHASQRALFASSLHRDFLAYADSCSAAPYIQDLAAIAGLRDAGFLPADALIVNGNTGDYLSGNHIAPALAEPRSDLDGVGRRRLIVASTLGKHFRLWDFLATAANDARIARRLEHEIEPIAAAIDDPETAHGVYEALEFENRQCKFVINGQRSYEFFGLDWRLPLWDDEYLAFWQAVPLERKANQALYRDMLVEANWGGVWQGDPWQFPQTVRPAWMGQWVRPLLRALHAPLGRRRWRRFERRYLQYWMETTAGSAVVPYWRVFTDRRGARNSVAWWTEAYLAGKGVAIDAIAGD